MPVLDLLRDPADAGWHPPAPKDSEVLSELLSFAGCGRESRSIADRLIGETGSLAAAVAASEMALRRLNVPGDAVRVIRLLRESLVGMLRREAHRRPQIGSGRELLDYLHAVMAQAPTERVRVLYLDAQNGLIRDQQIASGSSGRAQVEIRELLRIALEVGADAMILVHNHPSGDPRPSADDIALTRELEAAARLLDLEVHDHLIIGRHGHASLRALGYLGDRRHV